MATEKTVLTREAKRTTRVVSRASRRAETREVPREEIEEPPRVETRAVGAPAIREEAVARIEAVAPIRREAPRAETKEDPREEIRVEVPAIKEETAARAEEIVLRRMEDPKEGTKEVQRVETRVARAEATVLPSKEAEAGEIAWLKVRMKATPSKLKGVPPRRAEEVNQTSLEKEAQNKVETEANLERVESKSLKT